MEAGNYADIVEIDRNLFDIDPTNVSEARVELTMLDGAVRYRDEISM